ncbi:hypothetical protein SAMN04489742_1528 [Arthrobacter crystallopoietes]|uniref:Uncharacterized protein n=1 Tax=Crystallibacter crystallopoietes TaxID=37928 RepID=A0A1H1BR14_9MICC|nr:hypothetical protein SAMN04489742_1528 [Arthrobacter crystallopoietes]
MLTLVSENYSADLKKLSDGDSSLRFFGLVRHRKTIRTTPEVNLATPDWKQCRYGWNPHKPSTTKIGW